MGAGSRKMDILRMIGTAASALTPGRISCLDRAVLGWRCGRISACHDKELDLSFASNSLDFESEWV